MIWYTLTYRFIKRNTFWKKEVTHTHRFNSIHIRLKITWKYVVWLREAHLKNGHMWSPVPWSCTVAGVTSPLSWGTNPEIGKVGKNDSVFSALILLKWWWKCLDWIRENKTKKKENKSIKPVQLDQDSSGADVLAPYTLRHRGCDSFPLFTNN